MPDCTSVVSQIPHDYQLQDNNNSNNNNNNNNIVTHPSIAKGTYRVLKHLGSGGFSTVYEAQDSAGKTVALKKSHITKHVKNPMLRHEACALSLLVGHPSIPSVYAWGRSQYFEYLAMDLLGRPLTSLLKESNLRSVLLLVDQMLDTLEYMHSHHIIHRDVKPDNFMFGIGERAARVYLIDFSFSRYYRDPVSLKHYPLEHKQHFVGTTDYASRNAHFGLSLSRRDDLESLAYTVVALLKGTLPWESCHNGTIKHRENSVREKKCSWTGARLCAGLPEEFSEFVDYVRGLEYEQQPDYEHWKDTFRALFNRLFQDEGGFQWESAGDGDTSNKNPEQVPSSDPGEHHLQRIDVEKEPPVVRGQYILAQILPQLTIEGESDLSVDKSRWHDPSFMSDHWRFPQRPALVLDVEPVQRRRGAFTISLLPLVRKAGKLTVEESERFICLRQRAYTGNERVVVPSAEWTSNHVYHAPPPKVFRVQIEPDQVPIRAQWELDEAQLMHLETLLAAPLPAQLSSEAQKILADIEAIKKQFSFTAYARISPLTSEHVASSAEPGSSEESISWEGSGGFVEELVRISRRRCADSGQPWSDEEEDNEEEIDSSDDDFVPTRSWPTPHAVSTQELLGDEEAILKGKVTIITAPPDGSKDLTADGTQNLTFAYS